MPSAADSTVRVDVLPVTVPTLTPATVRATEPDVADFQSIAIVTAVAGTVDQAVYVQALPASSPARTWLPAAVRRYCTFTTALPLAARPWNRSTMPPLVLYVPAANPNWACRVRSAAGVLSTT